MLQAEELLKRFSNLRCIAEASMGFLLLAITAGDHEVAGLDTHLAMGMCGDLGCIPLVRFA